MDKSKKKNKYKRKKRFRWMPNWFFIVLAASMIGFSNCYYEEYRWIDSCRNFIQYEQVFEDEDKYKKYKRLRWTRFKRTNNQHTGHNQ